MLVKKLSGTHCVLDNYLKKILKVIFILIFLNGKLKQTSLFIAEVTYDMHKLS